MKNVFFDPWVGTNYSTGGIFNKKILILGESHHCDCNDCGDNCGKMAFKSQCDIKTTNVVHSYLNDYCNCGAWKSTFCKFERAMVNKVTNSEDSQAIWNSVIFYNYIQKAMQQPRQAPNEIDWQKSNIAFFEVLDKYKPDYIIVWGRRLWQNLPNEGNEGLPIVCDELANERTWEYHLPSGHIVKMMAVIHPSTGFSWGTWNTYINEFITNH